jgi:uncharacterized tellurite resistance protein B-like protein
LLSLFKKNKMSIIDLLESSKHRNSVAHFAAIVNIAAIDGIINEKEKAVINTFASMLDITEDEYKNILKEPHKYPLIAVNSSKRRMHVLYDLFKIIYSDHDIDEPERKAIIRYAIGLGYPLNKVEEIIEKSINIFSGNIDFDDYKYFINK